MTVRGNPFGDSPTDDDGRDRGERVGHDSSEGLEGSRMQFCIGDTVREGRRVGTVTDVGTVLIQVETTAGSSRMVCPWELVRVRPHATHLVPTSVGLNQQRRGNRNATTSRSQPGLGTRRSRQAADECR